MKDDCWKILGIDKTVDINVIKSAYRDLIKKYHPDTVQAPEKIRKYTIRCAEIIQAYKDAIKYAESNQYSAQTIPSISITLPEPRVVKRSGIFARAFAGILLILLISPAILVAIELANIYPALTNTTRFMFSWYNSMNPESITRMTISLFLALILGGLLNGLLSTFTTTPIYYLWGVLSDTRYERYMYKVGYFLIIVMNITVIYFPTGLHWPFEHRSNAYYNFLYHLCRFLAWSYLPIYLAGEWVAENLIYLRIKRSHRIDELAVERPNSI